MMKSFVSPERQYPSTHLIIGRRQTRKTKSSWAPMQVLLPHAFLFLLILFGFGTVILHNYATISAIRTHDGIHLPHGLSAFHPLDGVNMRKGLGDLNQRLDEISDIEMDPTSPFVEQRQWYKQLRQSFDEEYSSFQLGESDVGGDQVYNPEAYDKLVKFTKELHGSLTFPLVDTGLTKVPYDVFDCPSEPPANYPVQFPLVDLLSNWNPDNVTMNRPAHPIHIGLCIFDYTNRRHYAASLIYRKKELPFVLRYHPEILPTVFRWNHPSYMKELLDIRHLPPQRTEYSKNNHFMFWRLPGRNRNKNAVPHGWQAPTENIELSYQEWLSHANITASKRARTLNKNDEHYYYRLNGCSTEMLDFAKDFALTLEEGRKPHGSTPSDKCPQLFLFDELPYFTPWSIESSDFLIEPQGYRGINCRFGMEGAIAENHFDMTRNFVTVLKGDRRYILSHPNQCGNMALYPKNHPSGRHSIIDWSDIHSDPTWKNKFPEFYTKATANEVVLQAGDALYLPTNWMHYIVSLNLNYQCNARSGMTDDYNQEIIDCGF